MFIVNILTEYTANKEIIICIFVCLLPCFRSLLHWFHHFIEKNVNPILFFVVNGLSFFFYIHFSICVRNFIVALFFRKVKSFFLFSIGQFNAVYAHTFAKVDWQHLPTKWNLFASERYTFAVLYVHQIRGPNAVLLIYFCSLSSLYFILASLLCPDPNNCPAFSSLETKVNLGYVVTLPLLVSKPASLHTLHQNLTLAAGHAAFTGQSVGGQTSIYGNGSLKRAGLHAIFGSTTKGALSLIIVFIGDMATSCAALPTLSTAMKIITWFPNSSVLASSPALATAQNILKLVSVNSLYLQYYEPTQSRFSPFSLCRHGSTAQPIVCSQSPALPSKPDLLS